MNVFHVEAQYHTELRNGSHRVKLNILESDIKFHINGMVVFPPNVKDHKDWTVYTPSIGRTRIIEFDGQISSLWSEIQTACIEVVQEQLRHERLDRSNATDGLENLSDEEMKKQIQDGLDNLPYA